MTIEQTLAIIAAVAAILTLILGFMVLIYKGGQWAGEAKQRSTNFQSQLVQMGHHWEGEIERVEEDIDRVQENTNEAHQRIDRILERAGDAPP